MLEITVKAKQRREAKAKTKPKLKNYEIIVLKPITKTDRKKDGSVVITKTYEKTNITRKINATAKVLKNENAKNNLERIKQIFNA